MVRLSTAINFLVSSFNDGISDKGHKANITKDRVSRMPDIVSVSVEKGL